MDKYVKVRIGIIVVSLVLGVGALLYPTNGKYSKYTWLLLGVSGFTTGSCVGQLKGHLDNKKKLNQVSNEVSENDDRS